MRQGNNLRVASICLYTPAAFFLGFSVGYIIITGPDFNKNISFISLGAGAGLLIAGGICELVSNAKILKGVKIFNHSKIQNNHTNLDLGFSPNGVILRLNF
jgi:hypothetical protein